MSVVAYADSLESVDAIRTGTVVDRLSGIGGIPRGVITEVFGDESVGKTTLCLHIVAAAQQQGLRCLWADVEYAYDPKYAAHLGVDNSKLGIIRERFAETTLDTLEVEIEKGTWDLVILDSVGGVLPRAEAEKSAEERTIGSQAGLIAKFCRKIVPSISIHNVAFIAINHSFIDIMGGKLLTSGGKKLRYHKAFSVRLKPKYGGTALKQGERMIGKKIVAVVAKNKIGGTEGMELEATLIFGSGFSPSADVLDEAIERGMITKRGNTYYFGSEKLGIGLSKVRQMLEQDAVLTEKVKIALHGTIQSGGQGEAQEG